MALFVYGLGFQLPPIGPVSRSILYSKHKSVKMPQIYWFLNCVGS